jgi:hypothetical protein
MDAAFDRLRRYARRHSLRLSEVARQVVDTDFATELLTDLGAAHPTPVPPGPHDLRPRIQR